jgi:hypothetical protein
MAQKVTVALEDDLDGGPADETVRLGFDGAEHEIDLSAKNARAFCKLLQPYVKHARKAVPGRRAAPPRGRPGGSVAARSGRGRKSTASRSMLAGGSRPA